jgi:hypothetical protein
MVRVLAVGRSDLANSKNLGPSGGLAASRRVATRLPYGKFSAVGYMSYSGSPHGSPAARRLPARFLGCANGPPVSQGVVR